MVRLRAAQLRRGALAGEVVAVASGRRYQVTSVEQLVAFLTRSCGEEETLIRQAMPPDDDPEEATLCRPT